MPKQCHNTLDEGEWQIYKVVVSCFSSFFLLFSFMSIYLLGLCGNFSDTVVGSCRLRFFSILSSFFFSF